MRYVVERMTLADIPRIVEIEKLAYTTPWPPSAYRKELQDNPLASYIVVRDTRLLDTLLRSPNPPEAPRRAFPRSLFSGWTTTPTNPQSASIIGFAGLWRMVNEGHVTTIAVHPDYRGRGIGELMLSSLISIAHDMHTSLVSLEVRVSNRVAQNLYRKYGFRDGGVRKRYYSDNHEDALVMWTDNIASAAYRERFDELQAGLVPKLAMEDGSLEGGAERLSTMDAAAWREDGS